MKRKKSAIEVMAKYCTSWQRRDILKSFVDQSLSPFSTVEEGYDYWAIAELGNLKQTKEGIDFWESVSSAIIFNDPKYLPPEFNQEADLQPEPITTESTQFPEEFASWLETITDERHRKFAEDRFDSRLWVLYEKEPHPAVRGIHGVTRQEFANMYGMGLNGYYPWPQPAPVLKSHDPINPETAKEGRFFVDYNGRKHEIMFTNGKVWIIDNPNGGFQLSSMTLEEIKRNCTHVTD